jgi:hypothetical protein
VPNFTIQLDTSKFEQAVKFVFANTQRALPEILNRAALVTIIGGQNVDGAMQRTPRASKEAIRAVPAKAVASYVLHKNAGISLTKTQLKQLIAKEYRRRVAAVGYTALVGWSYAAQDLGGRGMKGGHSKGKGFYTYGYAKPATYGHYEVIIANTTPAAELIGSGPLQAALNDTAADMIDYWQRQSGAIFNP